MMIPASLRTVRHVLVPVFFAAILLPSCATVHLWAVDDSTSADNVDWQNKDTKWTYWWGLGQNKPSGKDTLLCPHRAFSRIRVKTNLGYALITVGTLGLVIPQTVEWDCAPQDVPTEKFGD
ncbi:MAG: hypothetical protein IT227_07815 [Flavobacteriales bacterium]|nr:hypothetical protein [Flavobacteriales bacterium]